LKDFPDAGVIQLVQKIDLKCRSRNCEKSDPKDEESEKAKKVP
jgi:hypothetical protein